MVNRGILKYAMQAAAAGTAAAGTAGTAGNRMNRKDTFKERIIFV